MPSYSIMCPVYGGVERIRQPRAGFDAARTNNENKKHWANTDSLGPVSQLTPGVRKILRDRARYEVTNNTYAAGLVSTLITDTVGRGPRLEMQTDDERLNNAVQSMWQEWSTVSDFAMKMRVNAGVKYLAGEGFGAYYDSKRLSRMGLPVTLDIRLLEPDQIGDGVSNQWLYGNQDNDDGIICDADGEVIGYRVLRAHPGDNRKFVANTETDRVSADDMIHWFEPQRPGQLRGYTPLAAALPIFAQLRRYSQATITSAEIAAMLAGVLESDMPPGSDGNAVDQESFFDTIDLVRGTLLTLPSGTKATQFKPEQPTTNYPEFVIAKLKECGRLLNVPYGKMSGDYTAHTYSGGRMEDALYWSDREIERQALEAKVFNPIFYRWCDFARFAIPRLAAFKGRWHELQHVWHYDARPSAEPLKEAIADEANLVNGTDTYSAILARDGQTLTAAIAQRKRDMEAFENAGLPLPPWMTGSKQPARVGDGIPQNPADAKSELIELVRAEAYA